MPEQDVTAKLAWLIDREGFAAARTEFREAGKVIAQAERPLTRFNEQLERVGRLQRRGLLTRQQAFDARLQAAGQETISAFGLQRFINPFVAAAAGLTASMEALRRTLVGRQERRDTARAFGLFGDAADVGFDRLTGVLEDLGIAPEARGRIIGRIARDAFRRGRTDIDRFALEQYQNFVDPVRDPRARALIAEQVLGGRELGDPGLYFDPTIPQPGEGGPDVLLNMRRAWSRLRKILEGGFDGVVAPEPAGDL